MKEYKIEFEVIERSVYYASVKAKSPEEALRLWNDDPNQYDSEPDYTIECDDIKETAECPGEWEHISGISSRLKRYDEPIKLKQ